METRTEKFGKKHKEMETESDLDTLKNEILMRCRTIKWIYQNEYPKSDVYLSITITDESIMFSNRYWSEDKDHPINEVIYEL